MSLIKKYHETKPVCKVTFKLSKDIVSSADWVNLAGDFYDWDIETVKLKTGK